MSGINYPGFAKDKDKQAADALHGGGNMAW